MQTWTQSSPKAKVSTFNEKRKLFIKYYQAHNSYRFLRSKISWEWTLTQWGIRPGIADPRKRTWWKHKPFFLNVSWETWEKIINYVFSYVYWNDFIMFFLGVCACPQRGNAPLMTKKGSFRHIFLQITLVKHWIETLLMFLPMFSKNKHWKNIPYVYTMFLSWDRRSQDGFPAVLYFDILIFDINIGFMEID